MRLTARRAAFALLAALGLAWATAHAHGPAPALDARLRLVSGARLDQHGALSAGRALPPGASPAAAADVAALRGLSAALGRVPAWLAPAEVRVILEPELAAGVLPLKGAEFHEPSRALLLGRKAESLPPAVWLHELAHLRLAGARPSEQLAKRVLVAFEEGVADYYAAVFSGSPRLAALDEVRDLRAPEPLGESAWASLAFADFGPHRMGLALAAAWYAQDAHGAELAEVITCLDGESSLGSAAGPAHAVSALLAACSSRGRPFVAKLLRGWLPSTFLPRENTP